MDDSRTSSYMEIHTKISKARGEAKDHSCFSCGLPAYEWAYQHNGSPELLCDKTGFAYSEDVQKCYRPLCRSCHRVLDYAASPGSGRKKIEKALKGLVEKRLDPQFREEQTENLVRAARISAERLKNDTERMKKLRETARKNGYVSTSQRRRCSSCGMVSSPPSIGGHHRASGHTGWEPA